MPSVLYISACQNSDRRDRTAALTEVTEQKQRTKADKGDKKSHRSSQSTQSSPKKGGHSSPKKASKAPKEQVLRDEACTYPSTGQDRTAGTAQGLCVHPPNVEATYNGRVSPLPAGLAAVCRRRFRSLEQFRQGRQR